MHKFDSAPHDSLYREVMEKYLNIQQVIVKHDHLMNEMPIKEWKELKRRFWSQYVYPKYKTAYFDLFPGEKGKKYDPLSGDTSSDYIQKMIIALCEWLKREGFFHFFEGEFFFVTPDSDSLAFIITDGVSFRHYPPEYIGMLLERVVADSIDKRKEMEKLKTWIVGLIIVLGMLLSILISKG